jgi:hypothetical protein
VSSERLEPDEGKLSCPVLRGEKGSNAFFLPDRIRTPNGKNDFIVNEAEINDQKR